jgi:acyl carrier protein
MPADTALIRKAWEEVLKAPVADDADFFENGGHSLLAVELSMVIEEKVGIEPPPDLVYQRRTFSDYVAAPEFR